MVLKTERELLLEKESTTKISTKREYVGLTREGERERERERVYIETMMIIGDISYKEKIQE